jgi:hypothetical protein
MATNNNRKPSPVVVDADHLPEEWARQPDLMLNACEAEAEADYEHGVAEAAEEFIKNDLIIRIRETPSDYDLDDKPPEYVVKARVYRVPEYQEAVKKRLEARRRLKVMGGRVSALAHKRTSIENLTILQLVGMNAEPRNRMDSPDVRAIVNKARDARAFKGIDKHDRR